MTKSHNHASSSEEVNTLALKNDLKREAELSPIPLKEIYSNMVSPEQAAEMTTFVSFESTMYKRRRRDRAATPTTRAEFDQALREMPSVNRFYKGFVVAGDTDFSILFASDEVIQAATSTSVLLVDGTFKTVPASFYQLLTIHCVHYDTQLPVIFALMTSKTRILYDSVLLKCKSLFPVNPERIICDFETALQSSLQMHWPDALLQGCYFHYTQAIWKKSQSLGLRFMEDDAGRLRTWLRQVMSLPLLPADKIQATFQTNLHPTTLPSNFSDDNGLLAFYSYVEDYWLTRVGTTTLSVFGRHRRTNSEVEVFHHTLLNRMRQTHPNFWVFVERLQAMSKSFQVELRQLTTGAETRRVSRPKYARVDGKINAAELLLTAGRLSPIQFLTRVSFSSYGIWRRNVYLNDNENDSSGDDFVDVRPSPEASPEASAEEGNSCGIIDCILRINTIACFRIRGSVAVFERRRRTPTPTVRISYK